MDPILTCYIHEDWRSTNFWENAYNSRVPGHLEAIKYHSQPINAKAQPTRQNRRLWFERSAFKQELMKLGKQHGRCPHRRYRGRQWQRHAA